MSYLQACSLLFSFNITIVLFYSCSVLASTKYQGPDYRRPLPGRCMFRPSYTVLAACESTHYASNITVVASPTIPVSKTVGGHHLNIQRACIRVSGIKYLAFIRLSALAIGIMSTIVYCMGLQKNRALTRLYGCLGPITILSRAHL